MSFWKSQKLRKVKNLCPHQIQGHMGDFKSYQKRDLGMEKWFLCYVLKYVYGV